MMYTDMMVLGGVVGWKQREENVITCLRIGHTGLNYTLYKTGKHPTGKSTRCSQAETDEHVQHRKYNIKRNHLLRSLRKTKHHHFSWSGLLGETVDKIYCDIFKRNRLAQRIWSVFSV